VGCPRLLEQSNEGNEIWVGEMAELSLTASSNVCRHCLQERFASWGNAHLNHSAIVCTPFALHEPSGFEAI